MDFTDFQGNNLNDWVKAYREALSRQYENTANQLTQSRRNAQTTLRASANKAGMLYSNFPNRDMIKYDAETYTPNLVKAQTSYRTGLDTLRNNAVSMANAIKSTNEAIDELNSYYND